MPSISQILLRLRGGCCAGEQPLRREARQECGSRATTRIRREICRCLQDRSGVAAILLGILIIPLVGGMALAVDASIAFMVESRLSKAIDAAALAAARAPDEEKAEELALAYFAANFDEASGMVTMGDIDVDFDDETHKISISADASVNTYFARVIGFDTLPVSARTVVERLNTGMELALVLDITASMYREGRFDAMQAAALDMIDTIYGDESEIDNIWVSIVPYVGIVNMGKTHTDWLEPRDRVFTDPDSWDPDPEGWKGCVMARADGDDQNDKPPSEAPFTSFYSPSHPYGPPIYRETIDSVTKRYYSVTQNLYPPIVSELDVNIGMGPVYNSASGPNLGCSYPITPLTSSRATIDAALNDMHFWARGGTTGNLGLVWGWRTLSPRWRGLWGGSTPSDMPFDYDKEYSKKVVVILTDGVNMAGADPSAYGVKSATALGWPAGASKATRAKLDTRMKRTCQAMNAEGIEIYAITFGSDVDAKAQALFRNCATKKSMYFHAPNSATIGDVFDTIAGNLAAIRITE